MAKSTAASRNAAQGADAEPTDPTVATGAPPRDVLRPNPTGALVQEAIQTVNLTTVVSSAPPVNPLPVQATDLLVIFITYVLTNI